MVIVDDLWEREVVASLRNGGKVEGRSVVMTVAALFKGNLLFYKSYRCKWPQNARMLGLPPIGDKEESASLLTEFDAEIRFKMRMQKGTGKKSRSLELLTKAAGE